MRRLCRDRWIVDDIGEQASGNCRSSVGMMEWKPRGASALFRVQRRAELYGAVRDLVALQMSDETTRSAPGEAFGQ